MKKCNRCNIEKPVTEFNKSSIKKDGLKGHCKECSKIEWKNYHIKNGEALLEKSKQYRILNRDSQNQRAKDYYWKNSEEIKQKKREQWPERKAYYLEWVERTNNASRLKWDLKNKDKKDAYRKEWKLLNPGKVNAQTAKRRATKLQATPVWSDLWMMQEIYDLAVLRTKLTGVKHVVDHVVPLTSKVVSGLHVPANLRVIPEKPNLHKSNKFNPDTFDSSVPNCLQP